MRREGSAVRPPGGGRLLNGPVRRCAACGTACRARFQAPAAELAPDLDLRPGEPARSTLGRWVSVCRGCGAAGPDLTALPRGAAETVASEAYRALTGGGAEVRFLRWAMLHESAGETAEAAGAVLHAAWAVDDAGGDARPLRRRAAALWGEPATMQQALRLVDVLRRGEAFERAGAMAAALLARPGLNDTDTALLGFQQRLIAEGDAGRHLLSSALRPPARTPHVSHGQTQAAPATAARSLWRRLAGR